MFGVTYLTDRQILIYYGASFIFAPQFIIGIYFMMREDKSRDD